MNEPQPLRKGQKPGLYSGPFAGFLGTLIAWLFLLPLPIAITAVMAGIVSRIAYQLFLWGWDLLGMAS